MSRVLHVWAVVFLGLVISGAGIARMARAYFHETCIPSPGVDCSHSYGTCFFGQGTCIANPGQLGACVPKAFSLCPPASCEGICTVSHWWPCSNTGPGC